MAYLRWVLVFSWLIHLVATQSQTPIITKTVRSTCTRSASSLTLPLAGWISTNGTRSPYTFGSSTASFAADTILPVTGDLPLSIPGSRTSNLPDGTLSSASQTSTGALSTASLPAITRIAGGTITSTILGGTTLTQSSSGHITTIVTGGLTTSYTTGGTTQTIYGVSEPTPTSSSVQDAVIGPCPAYNGRVYEDENGIAFLVACGSTYDGSVLSTYNRRFLQNRSLQIRATSDDCTSQCTALMDCVAASYSGSICTFYESISGQLLSALPAFSAARLVLNTVEPVELANTTSGSAPLLASSSIVPRSTNGQISSTFSNLPAETTGKPGEVSISTLVSVLPASSFTMTITSTVSGSPVVITTSLAGQTTTAVFTTALPASTVTITTVTTRDASTSVSTLGW